MSSITGDFCVRAEVYFSDFQDKKNTHKLNNLYMAVCDFYQLPFALHLAISDCPLTWNRSGVGSGVGKQEKGQSRFLA